MKKLMLICMLAIVANIGVNAQFASIQKDSLPTIVTQPSYEKASAIVLNSNSGLLVQGINVSTTTTVCYGQKLDLAVGYTGSIHHVIWISNPQGLKSTNLILQVSPTQTTDYYAYLWESPMKYVGYVKLTVLVVALPVYYHVSIDGIISPEQICIGSHVVGLISSDIGSTYVLKCGKQEQTLQGIGIGIKFNPIEIGKEDKITITAINQNGCSSLIYEL